MAHDDDKQVIRAAYDFQLALMGNGSLTEESFKSTQERAKEAFNDLISAVYPWAAKSAEEVKRGTFDSLIETYKETFGIQDLNDPEFVRKIEEGIEDDRRRRSKYQARENDEDRINRLLRERDEAARGLR